MSDKSVAFRGSSDLLICKACGTQYSTNVRSKKDECKICDDPRQYVPASGQAFSTLTEMKMAGHKNVWWQDKHEPRIWSVKTEPEFAIGNRAELIQTDAGNILMDLIPYLDEETVEKIQFLGGLSAIVISHPHYYSTWADWSRTFNCPVYAAAADREWLEMIDTTEANMQFLTETTTPIKLDGKDSGATAIIAAGHFPGSLLLHWEKNLFIADTIFTVPSATNPVPGKPGVISFSFFWSIPNRIPLHPDAIQHIWKLCKKLDFDTCFGAFKGMDVYTMDNEHERGTGGMKGRLLESCKIYVKAEGWKEHAILTETPS